MRAALYNGQKNIEMTELTTPEAGENDIVVKNIYASICGTDVAVYEHGPGTEFIHIPDLQREIRSVRVQQVDSQNMF